MTASSLIGVETGAALTEVWALSSLFSPDWQQGVRVASRFETAIEGSLSDSEQRFGLRGLPVRTIDVLLQAWTPAQVLALRSFAMRHTKAKSLVPLFSDMARVDAITASDTSCGLTDSDGDYHRFGVGHRALLIDLAATPKQSKFEAVTLSAVSATSLSWSSGGVANSYPAATSVVLPLIEAEVILDHKGVITTDKTATLAFKAVEAVGPPMAPLFGSVGTNPPGFTTHDGIPIFAQPSTGAEFQNFREPHSWGISRSGKLVNSGLDVLVDAQGSRGRYSYLLNLLARDRVTAYNVIRFFESRGGRLLPFWFVSPLSDFTLDSIPDTTHVHVAAVGPEYDWNFRPHLALTRTDGTIYIRKISGVTRNGEVDEITLTTALPSAFAVSTIDRTSLAHAMRFDQDELTESWVTADKMEARLAVIEVDPDDVTTIPDLDPIPPGTPIDPFVPRSGEGEADPIDVHPVRDCRTGLDVGLYVKPEDAATLAAFRIGTKCLYTESGITQDIPPDGEIIEPGDETALNTDCAECSAHDCRVCWDQTSGGPRYTCCISDQSEAVVSWEIEVVNTPTEDFDCHCIQPAILTGSVKVPFFNYDAINQKFTWYGKVGPNHCFAQYDCEGFSGHYYVQVVWDCPGNRWDFGLFRSTSAADCEEVPGSTDTIFRMQPEPEDCCGGAWPDDEEDTNNGGTFDGSCIQALNGRFRLLDLNIKIEKSKCCHDGSGTSDSDCSPKARPACGDGTCCDILEYDVEITDCDPELNGTYTVTRNGNMQWQFSSGGLTVTLQRSGSSWVVAVDNVGGDCEDTAAPQWSKSGEIGCPPFGDYPLSYTGTSPCECGSGTATVSEAGI